MIEIEKPEIKTIGSQWRPPNLVKLSLNHWTWIWNDLFEIHYVGLSSHVPASIQIDGVLHEFATLKVSGRCLDYLNPEEISALKLHTQESKVIELNVTGPKVVTAADIMAITMQPTPSLFAPWLDGADEAAHEKRTKTRCA